MKLMLVGRGKYLQLAKTLMKFITWLIIHLNIYIIFQFNELIPSYIIKEYNNSLKSYANKKYGNIDPFKKLDIKVINRILKYDNTECSKLLKFKFKDQRCDLPDVTAIEHTIIVQVICKDGKRPRMHYKFITKVIHDEKRSTSFRFRSSLELKKAIYKNKKLIYE